MAEVTEATAGRPATAGAAAATTAVDHIVLRVPAVVIQAVAATPEAEVTARSGNFANLFKLDELL